MHGSVLEWVPTALPAELVAGRSVLEVGAYDVNGSVRPSIEAGAPASYLGVDATPGPRVDRVVDCELLVETFGPSSFDIVISTEMLEHVERWRPCILALAEVTDDLLVITTRSAGFPYHPFPGDFWRYSVEQMHAILDAAGLTDVQVVPDPQHPGVFATARKAHPWVPDLERLDRIQPTTP